LKEDHLPIPKVEHAATVASAPLSQANPETTIVITSRPTSTAEIVEVTISIGLPLFHAVIQSLTARAQHSTDRQNAGKLVRIQYWDETP
jgi:hypothetical protein